MTLLIPKANPIGWWEHRRSSPIWYEHQEMVFYQDKIVEMIHVSSVFSERSSYFLYGTYEEVTASYGIITVNRIEFFSVGIESPHVFDLVDFDGILFEYFDIPATPYRLHPIDAIVVNGNWPQTYDRFLVTHRFLDDIIISLEDVIANPSEDTPLMDGSSVEAVIPLLRQLDKLKLSRMSV